MKTFTLVSALLVAAVHPAAAQELRAPAGVPIESVEVSGLSINELSPGLRRAIRGLVDMPLNHEMLAEMADRIEAERTDVVAAVRTVPRPDAKARVIFLVGRLDDDSSLRSNINARYVVESVSIEGIPDTRVSKSLRDELQTLVGSALDHDVAERLRERLANELAGRHVRRRIARGSERGRIQVVFDVETPLLIPDKQPPSKFIYHGDLGWTGVIDFVAGSDTTRGNFGVIFGDRDDLVETYRGYRFGFESRKLANDHVGASLQFSWLRQSWEQVTLDALAADPAIPAAYDTRRTIEPAVTFAVDPHVRVRIGASTTELGPRAGSSESRMANAMVASIGYDQRWRPESGGTHRVEASYVLRTTTDAFGGDFTYRRHFADARYEFEHRHSHFMASAFFGGLTGQAPLFERFTLGDSATLRGWNKFDIAPVGGDRVIHESIEYRFHSAALFLDAGSVWKAGDDRKTRFSTGFGFHGDNAFATLAFPLNADKVGATFMMGLRF